MSENRTTIADPLAEAKAWSAAEGVVRAFCDAEPHEGHPGEEASCNWPHCGCEMRPREALIRHTGAATDEIERLRAALTALLDRYVTMVNSGDCGFWDPEKEPDVIKAREALQHG